ncbi:uncharacterized protein M6B38_347970 [Iris pallida]|uniref:Uncharacterized protein n=1 Tax=Iris pallida TaxID=29817 RepID=A0AAX6GTX7_IRIPA|nr:uncharacterized protein M6B38_347970 [Iris pallida]
MPPGTINAVSAVPRAAQNKGRRNNPMAFCRLRPCSSLVEAERRRAPTFSPVGPPSDRSIPNCSTASTSVPEIYPVSAPRVFSSGQSSSSQHRCTSNRPTVARGEYRW